MFHRYITPAAICLSAIAPQAIAESMEPTITGYHYRIEEGSEFRIQFKVPMVADEEVGKPVRPGFFTTSIPDCATAIWENSSTINITINTQLPSLCLLGIDVPAGLRGLNGESIPGKSAQFPTTKGSFLNTRFTEGDDIFLTSYNEYDKETLQQRLPQLRYYYQGEFYPLAYQAATIADAKKYPHSFRYGPFGSISEEDLKQAPDDKVIPGIWKIQKPGIPTGSNVLQLALPGAAWDYKYSHYKDYIFSSTKAPALSYDMKTTCTAPGKYKVQMNFGMPAAALDAASIIPQLRWSISSLQQTEPEHRIPLIWQDGALRAQWQGKTISLTPKEIKKEKVKLVHSGEVEGITSITFEADTSDTELSFFCEGDYTAIAPTAPKEKPCITNTALRPEEPYIYTDITANQMQLVGSTKLRCRYGYLRNGSLHIMKLNCTPAETVRIMQNYRLRYKGGRYMHGGYLSYQGEKAHREAGLSDDKLEDNTIDSAALPGNISIAERNLENGKRHDLTLALSELFPGQQLGGLYVVNIKGTPWRQSKTPALNQGLIQVTDLGLLWKTNGEEIFARGYSLSTAKEIPAATLKLFNKEGQQLAIIPMKDGLAHGSFPQETAYLQLLTENDCVTLPHTPKQVAQWSTGTYKTQKLMKEGINPAELSTPLVYLFSDRNLYRPGETAHIKGIARRVQNNQVLPPDIESITATLLCDGENLKEYPVTVAEDGNFSLDVTMDKVGHHILNFELTYKDNGQALPEAAKPQRLFSISLNCKEFRRNEFEVESSMNVQQNERRVIIDAKATNLTTTPVSHGKVRWHLNAEDSNFYPEQPEWRSFRFGDFRNNPWDYFYAYNGGRYQRQTSFSDQQIAQLDAEGKGQTVFTLPEEEFPRTRRLTATTIVTNGNEQSISSVRQATLHPADVYAGIRAQQNMAKVDGTLPIELVAVKPNGQAWDGAPLPATVKVSRTIYRPYRYGSAHASSVRNTEETNKEQQFQVSLTGQPCKLDIPLGRAGHYDVEVSGKDSQGRKFCSATRYYVWGDDVSPWRYHNNNHLEMIPDKPQYQPGETARILVQTPVDAELLFTVERDRVLRHYRRSVTVDNPVVEIPIEATDAPVAYLNVSLVQSDTNRSSDGKPQVKLGTCTLNIAVPDKILTVKTDAEQTNMRPGEDCSVSGVITDAAGNPVPNADITLYAEDEGTLQVTGYKLPDPTAYFYSAKGREHHVCDYSGLRHLVSENLKSRYLGNKGVFIGGGDGDYGSIHAENEEYLRQDFNPCALWLASLRTDAQGRFRTTYKNPDTLTRYRLMAVASAGDKFGAGQSNYVVNKAIMLEPSAPMSAAEGDKLLLPVTVSMLPEQLPAGSGNDITWQVSLSGSNVDLPTTTQSVTLHGNQPITLHFPVNIQKAQPTQLQWRVQPAQEGVLSKEKDAIQLSFEAIPPTPYLRESIHSLQQNEQHFSLQGKLRNQYLPGSQVELTLSTSPLSGAAYPIKYLLSYPYGCTEQLSSAVLPWILREDLKLALGLPFPNEKEADKIIADTKHKLQERRLRYGSYSYWSESKEESEFSAYAVMMLHLMGEDMDKAFSYLHKNITENKGNPYLNLMVLALTNHLYYQDLDTILKRDAGKDLTEQQRWVLAFCAHLLNHPQAKQLHRNAIRATNSHHVVSYQPLPPVRAIRALYTIMTAPQSPATVTMLRDYLRQPSSHYSTWSNAWMLIAVHAYSQQVDLSKLRATVNGNEISAASPLLVNTTTDSTASWQCSGDPVYISGYAEGHLVQHQAVQAIDKGFLLERSYKRVMPDGSLQPTATFNVGDIVHVTVRVQPTAKNTIMRYLVIEDRLPAAFEAVDPELISQALPAGMSAESMRRLYYFPAFINNREFLKDRVRAFSTSAGGYSYEFSYAARVVRSGSVTAPAAKAELMYNPEVYGLSIPQHFEIPTK